MDLCEEQLIREVKSRRILYNKSEYDYKISDRRENAWQEVAEAINCEVNLCKKRWRSLRDVFIKQYKQMHSVSRSKCRRKTWAYYKHMEFLLPHIETRKYDHSSQENSSEYNNDLGPILEPKVILEEPMNDEDEKETSSPLIKYLRTPQNITNQSEMNAEHSKLKIDDVFSNPDKKHDPRISNEKSLDADEHFLMSLVPTLKRLSQKKNAEAKIKFQQILYELEYTNQEPIFCKKCSVNILKHSPE